MLCHEVIDDPWRGIRGDTHILQKREHACVLGKNNSARVIGHLHHSFSCPRKKTMASHTVSQQSAVAAAQVFVHNTVPIRFPGSKSIPKMNLKIRMVNSPSLKCGPHHMKISLVVSERG